MPLPISVNAKFSVLIVDAKYLSRALLTPILQAYMSLNKLIIDRFTKLCPRSK